MDRAWIVVPTFSVLVALASIITGLVALYSDTGKAAFIVTAWAILIFVACVGFVGIMNSLRAFVRAALPRPEALRARMLSATLRGGHWSLILCHHSDTVAADWLDAALAERTALVGTVVVFERGVTTDAALEKLRNSPLVRQRTADPATLIVSESEALLIAAPAIPAGFYRGGRAWSVAVALYVVAFFLVYLASFTAWVEGDACNEASCDERPTTNWDALYWVLNRLFGGDPEGMGAATVPGRIIGILVSIGGVVAVGVFLGSVVSAIVERLTSPTVDLEVGTDPQAARGPQQADLGEDRPHAGDGTAGPIVTVQSDRSLVDKNWATAAGLTLTVTFAVGAALGAWIKRRPK